MPYGALWIMKPDAACLKGLGPEASAIAYAMVHFGAVLQNTTGSTKSIPVRLYNAIGLRYPDLSPYDPHDIAGLGTCHLLTDGYILPHGPIQNR